MRFLFSSGSRTGLAPQSVWYRGPGSNGTANRHKLPAPMENGILHRVCRGVPPAFCKPMRPGAWQTLIHGTSFLNRNRHLLVSQWRVGEESDKTKV